MWIAVIASLVCFAVSIILFTPPLRPFPFYQSIAFFFLFEGLWSLINGATMEIWSYSNFMSWVQYIGIIVFAGYIFYSVFSYHHKNTKPQEEKSQNMEPSESVAHENITDTSDK